MTAPGVKMTVHWLVPVGESGTITRALQQLMIAARTSPGCLGCSISTEMNTQSNVRYVERWATEDLLRHELRSDRFVALASLMEHATGSSRIRVRPAGRHPRPRVSPTPGPSTRRVPVEHPEQTRAFHAARHFGAPPRHRGRRARARPRRSGISSRNQWKSAVRLDGHLAPVLLCRCDGTPLAGFAAGLAHRAFIHPVVHPVAQEIHVRLRPETCMFAICLCLPAPPPRGPRRTAAPTTQRGTGRPAAGRRGDRPQGRHRSRAHRRSASGRSARPTRRRAWCSRGRTARRRASSARRGATTTRASGSSDGCGGDFSSGRHGGRDPPEPKKKAPRYIPNGGFLIVEGDKGEIYVRLFSYVRYLNQQGLDETYTDAFGNVHTVQRRQDVQLQKFFLPFTGWFLTPKFRYYLYVWSSNPSQGDPAQVVGAGNISYVFNRYVTFGGGITSLPSVRSTEGQFPYWLGVDDRLIADEFFRGSYTTGFWLKGELATKFKYMAMIANNLSTLGVSASQMDNTFDTQSVHAAVAAHDRRVRPVRHVRRLRLPREARHPARRALHVEHRGQAESAGHERDREQPDSPDRRQHHLHARSVRRRASPSSA